MSDRGLCPSANSTDASPHWGQVSIIKSKFPALMPCFQPPDKKLSSFEGKNIKILAFHRWEGNRFECVMWLWDLATRLWGWIALVSKKRKDPWVQGAPSMPIASSWPMRRQGTSLPHWPSLLGGARLVSWAEISKRPVPTGIQKSMELWASLD